MHESEPLDLICRLPESRRIEKHSVAAGHFHLSPADRAAHVGWTADKQSFVIAMENSFIERTIGNAFDGRVPEIRGRAALRDPAVEELIACLRRSLIDDSRCGGLCLDLVGTSLALRLFETYGENGRPPPSIRGGLGASRRRRIVDFIEAHLDEDIGLAALAAEAGLSPHHFGKAFKTTFGKPPCRYITERRIQKAKELLLSDGASITEIALALGFSSHSHFTDVFRKMTGTTPSLFRRNCT
ncbi:MAG: helix-turn-helix transcriptional regulator [Roseitalea sp.]|nr:helix-turn-helix transcriptional regulator [Roseitalea sp.]MBO6951443.1 helix-turn-helix transcriptional regulator [Rhizobiaceae bacterium]MBO6592710.1 helix-turn-helix transcriptional regulator [Roseitalea sp.]MBO6598965.1 helix-turn-helix transcriptional regulator [Roseitalea sp.]MBO6611412.1 helix-turn-helix transcriptional regulator [Roseitalea sp.]